MYQVTLVCDGLPPSAGPEAARGIAQEFAEHRKWHCNVGCEWDGSRLVLHCENDFDADGNATVDEFGDAISACLADPGKSSISIQSVKVLR